MNYSRIKKLIAHAINKFSLDLSGLTILTEAASGYYALTPIIAAASGADSVLAITKDSKYGKASENHYTNVNLAHEFGVNGKIKIIFDRDDPKIKSADIVTNLGFVRPLDKEFLRRLKKTVVIPLMWETWEYRQEDLDIEQCRLMGIPVLGTNEHDPRLRTMEYVGHIALKMLYKLDFEVFMSKVVILGSGEFGSQISKTLKSAGAEVVFIPSDNTNEVDTDSLKNQISQADVMVIAEHQNRGILIGPDSEIVPGDLYKCNPSLCIAHICGGVDQESIMKAGFRIIPDRIASPGFMSVGTDYLGPKPLIDLHTAGLKVGKMMSEARLGGINGIEAEMKVIEKDNLAQGFAGYHYRTE